MARKKLLTESEIRRFMKLANMGTVGDNRLNELGYMDEVVEEEPPLGVDEPVAGEPDVGEPDLGEPDVETDLGLGPDEEVAQEVVLGMLDVLKDWAKEEYDLDISTEETPGDEEGLELEEPPLELEEPPLDVGPPAEEPLGGPSEEEPVPGARQYQEALVSKVARRVAARLMQEDKNEKLAAELTERIFKRITSK